MREIHANYCQMDKLPPLTALKSFEAAARYGNFSQAAEELCVTQSALSHQVRQLEAWFGFELFTRNGRRISVTAKGAELATSLTEAFGDVARTCRRISAGEDKVVLTVAAIPSVATCWLIPRLNDFWQREPDIRIKLVYAIHGQPIDFQDIDIAIAYGEGDWSAVQATRLLAGAAMPVCSQAYLDDNGPFDQPDYLLDADLLHEQNRRGWENWFHAAGVKTDSLAPGPVFEDFNLLRSAALAGHGIALCAPTLLADDLISGRLVQLSQVPVQSSFDYYILEPHELPGDRLDARETFKAWLIDSAEPVSVPA